MHGPALAGGASRFAHAAAKRSINFDKKGQADYILKKYGIDVSPMPMATIANTLSTK